MVKEMVQKYAKSILLLLLAVFFGEKY